jgi:leucyl/phenylalanyl-tRNA--protein transferase
MSLTVRPDPPGESWWDTLPLLTAPADAPVVLGGGPTVPALVGAYRAGVFPWPLPDDDGSGGVARTLLRRRRRALGLPWWCPDPRAVIPAGAVHASTSLRRRLRRGDWTTTVDARFGEVVTRCRRTGAERWITDDLLAGYTRLHKLGWAHSLEVWEGDQVVGGVFGVLVGGVFIGESMFHDRTDASKAALVDLDARLTAAGGSLLEVQFVTSHLRTLGAVEIPRADYLAVLREVRDRDVRLVTDRLPTARLARAC